MIFTLDLLFRIALAVVLTVVWIAILSGVLFAVHFLITLPLRRAERARFFLDLVETALRHGEPLETALVSISDSRDGMLGARFHLLAAHLKRGMRLDIALEVVPRLLPSPITAMLKAGLRIGDLGKVIPACRQHLQDALSQTRSAINYVFILAFVITPGSLVLFTLISIKVFPSVISIADGLAATRPIGIEFLLENRGAIMLVQLLALLIVWTAAFIYASGPRAVSWIPLLHNLYFRLPWRRKRMQRDFSALLAVLLDSQVPEKEAVELAAECTANPVFQRRARLVAERLKQGAPLTEAVEALDDAGEFRWRLTNAAHGEAGFLAALTGWHEALDAKAFQQEQAAAHGITTGLVLVNGLFVGAVVISVFGFLISIINAGILW